MRYLPVILLTLHTVLGRAVDFDHLSRNEPVSTIYNASFKCYVDVSLSLNASAYNAPIFVQISYIIDNDTLNDLIRVDKTLNKVVKKLFLDEGERLTVELRLRNSETERVEGLQGSLSVVRNPDFIPSEGVAKNKFLSGVWRAEQTPLFRVAIKDSVPHLFRLKVDLNPNYEYDDLHLKVKVISPSQGILMLDRTVHINERSTIDPRPRSVTIDLAEVDMVQPGTYYFQVINNMAAKRINGIDQIDHEVVTE